MSTCLLKRLYGVLGRVTYTKVEYPIHLKLEKIKKIKNKENSKNQDDSKSEDEHNMKTTSQKKMTYNKTKDTTISRIMKILKKKYAKRHAHAWANGIFKLTTNNQLWLLQVYFHFLSHIFRQHAASTYGFVG